MLSEQECNQLRELNIYVARRLQIQLGDKYQVKILDLFKNPDDCRKYIDWKDILAGWVIKKNTDYAGAWTLKIGELFMNNPDYREKLIKELGEQIIFKLKNVTDSS